MLLKEASHFSSSNKLKISSWLMSQGCTERHPPKTQIYHCHIEQETKLYETKEEEEGEEASILKLLPFAYSPHYHSEVT
jgi:hypothetical protein